LDRFKGYMILSDIDGTLIDQNHIISRQNREAIAYFQSRGGIFTLATGRTPYGLSLIDSDLINAPIICYNGAVIHDIKTNQRLWHHPLPNDCRRAVEFSDAHLPETGIQVYTMDAIWIYGDNEIVQRHLAAENIISVRYTTQLDEIPTPWLKVIFMQPQDQTDGVRNLILKQDFAPDYHFVKSYKEYYEMLAKGVTKGSAMAQLAQMTGIDMQNIIAIGDNDNDIEMLHCAGCGVAVENATQPLKDIANKITVSHNDSAIAHIINHFDQHL